MNVQMALICVHPKVWQIAQTLKGATFVHVNQDLFYQAPNVTAKFVLWENGGKTAKISVNALVLRTVIQYLDAKIVRLDTLVDLVIRTLTNVWMILFVNPLVNVRMKLEGK